MTRMGRCVHPAFPPALSETEERPCHVETAPDRTEWARGGVAEGGGAAAAVAAWAETAQGPAHPGPVSARAAGNASPTPRVIRAIG